MAAARTGRTQRVRWPVVVVVRRPAVTACFGGVGAGVLSSLAFERMADPTAEQDWLFPVFYLGLPLLLGVLAALCACSQRPGHHDEEIYALALCAVSGWGVGFALAETVAGGASFGEAVGGVVIVGIVAALCCRGAVTLLGVRGRWRGRGQTPT